MTEATNSKRLYFASAPILLVAHWLDTLEISILTGKIRLLCEEIIGGRQTLLYDPEIVLASRALYLGCAILPSTCAPSTPAQDFCGVFLVGKGFDTNKLVLSFEERFRLWLSMCLMPYLYDRREQLASHIGRMYCVLTEQEELHQVGQQETRIVNASVADDASSSTVTSFAPSAIRRSIEIIVKSCFGDSNSERLITLASLLKECNQLLYLRDNRTIYFAMRIFGVSCVSTNRVPVQTKLKSLAWLLLFRFGFMAYYSVRVLIKEMTQDSLQASLETKETSSEEVTENNEPEKRSPSCIANGRCVLCMDSLEKPTAAPCGHIFCWDCIIPMIVGSKQRSQSQDWSQEELERDSVKCPICRKAFQSGALLPLHCYS